MLARSRESEAASGSCGGPDGGMIEGMVDGMVGGIAGMMEAWVGVLALLGSKPAARSCSTSALPGAGMAGAANDGRGDCVETGRCCNIGRVGCTDGARYGCAGGGAIEGGACHAPF